MDARVRGESQSRRTSIKRPWDEITLPEAGNAHNSALLPPIDAVPYRRPSIPRGLNTGFSNNRYGPDLRESGIKKAKVEGYDYNPLSQQFPGNVRIPPPMPQNPGYEHIQHRGSIESLNFPPRDKAAGGGPAESQDIPILCSRCRRLATQDLDSVDQWPNPDNCESCKSSPELAWVTQAAANGLHLLAQKLIQQTEMATDTLPSGKMTEQSGTIRRELGPADCPPIAQFGLKQTLDWILGKINQCNYLVDDLVRQVPAGTSRNDKDIFQNGPNPKDGPLSIMKRRIDVDSSEDAFRMRAESAESTSDAKPHTRRRSVTTGPLVDEVSPMRSQSDYHPSLHSLDGQASRLSIMNPPPAPTRQLLSPPGRSLPSPTSLNFPSPSASSYGNPAQGVNLPPPSSLHQSTINNYLPPIATAHSPDSALREHTAALQHEVSVQKIALSSLQGEHDKLLAAFSRSQLRASTLEKKHAVSDSEIISLTEEKMRLQAQVENLERDVDDLSRSRDEFRQAAVQEGSQYVEIVKKASQLEEMAGEERKSWNNLKEEMEARIQALSAAKSRNDASAVMMPDFAPARRIMDDIDTRTPASSVDLSTGLKIEPTSGPTSFPYPTSIQQESTEDLKEEIRRLRERCTEVEDALRAIRDDSRSMDGFIKALIERADSILP